MGNQQDTPGWLSRGSNGKLLLPCKPYEVAISWLWLDSILHANRSLCIINNDTKEKRSLSVEAHVFHLLLHKTLTNFCIIKRTKKTQDSGILVAKYCFMMYVKISRIPFFLNSETHYSYRGSPRDFKFIHDPLRHKKQQCYHPSHIESRLSASCLTHRLDIVVQKH